MEGLGKNFDYMLECAEELDVDLGGINTKLYVMQFITDLCLEIEGLDIERATRGIITAMKEMDLKPYQLSFYREGTELFRYI